MHALTRTPVEPTRVRPYVLAGAAMATAAAMAISPLALSGAPSIVGDVQQSIATVTAKVTLTGLQAYQQVIDDAIANYHEVTGSSSNAPGVFPILAQILTNQQASGAQLSEAFATIGPKALDAIRTKVPEMLAAAGDALKAGDLATAINTVVLAAITPITSGLDLLAGPIVPAIQNALSVPLQNLINVIEQAPNLILPGLLIPLSPILGGAGGLVQSVQNIIDAVRTADPAGVLNAVVTAPAVLLDGILNGGYGINLGPIAGLDIPGFTVVAGGLFNPGVITDDKFTLPGSLSMWKNLQSTIVAAITPPSARSVSSIPTTLSAAASSADTARPATTLSVTVPASSVTPAAAPTPPAGTGAPEVGESAGSTTPGSSVSEPSESPVVGGSSSEADDSTPKGTTVTDTEDSGTAAVSENQSGSGTSADAPGASSGAGASSGSGGPSNSSTSSGSTESDGHAVSSSGSTGSGASSSGAGSSSPSAS